MYTISDEKLEKITEILNNNTDPRATEELVRAQICGDWNDGDDHQEWIDNATPDEIAEWLATFYQ